MAHSHLNISATMLLDMLLAYAIHINVNYAQIQGYQENIIEVGIWLFLTFQKLKLHLKSRF